MSGRVTGGARGMLLGVMLLGCAHGPAPSDSSEPPPLVLGDFVDDYGIAHTITKRAWLQRPHTRYEIVAWAADGRSLVARNATDNPADAGRWTRIEWVELADGGDYRWAFCITAWKAQTRESAEATRADASQPKSGCNGFPFSRMRQASHSAAPSL